MVDVGFTLFAVDPGWSTGWAMFGVTDGKVELLTQGTVEGGLEGWVQEVGLYPIRGAVVCEAFIVEPSYVGRAWSSEVLGAVRLASRDEFVLQSRSDKATLFTQKHLGDKGETERFAWLRERGFDGTPHELDAITHALVYLKRQRNRVALKQYWNI